MALKLYTAEEIKSSKATELARDVMRTSDIKKALDKARTELNNVNAQFEVALANQRVKWISEEEVALGKIRDLETELKVLERRKQQALIPIDLYRQRVDNITKEANDKLKSATDKQIYVDELSEKLEEKLDEVSEKDQSLQKREENLFVKEKAVQMQEEGNKKMSQEINTRALFFIKEMEDREKDFNNRKTALELKEISLQELERSLRVREQDLIKEKQLIYSQRQALKAALQLKK